MCRGGDMVQPSPASAQPEAKSDHQKDKQAENSMAGGYMIARRSSLYLPRVLNRDPPEVRSGRDGSPGSRPRLLRACRTIWIPRDADGHDPGHDDVRPASAVPRDAAPPEAPRTLPTASLREQIQTERMFASPPRKRYSMAHGRVVDRSARTPMTPITVALGQVRVGVPARRADHPGQQARGSYP